MIHEIAYPHRWRRVLRRYAQLIRIFSNWPLYFLTKLGWPKNKSLRLTTRRGLVIEVPGLLLNVFKDIFLYEAYGLDRILQQLPPQPVVVDVGANLGFFSLYALDLRPAARCLSFEPLLANHRRLEAQRQRNPQANWQVIRRAVSGSNGPVQIRAEADGTFSGSACVAAPGTAPIPGLPHTEQIEAQTLASAFQEHSLTVCHWLKMDCEGAEYDILYHTPEEILERIACISLETHPGREPDQHPLALRQFLQAHGFEHIFLADDAVIHALRRL